MRFEWNAEKAAENIRKHKISFEEASTVFFDDHGKVAHDPDHSNDEDRFLIIGMSSMQRLLIVAHCYRESDEVIRIISARKLDRKERKQYEEGL